ncbi:MAG TPA: 30S ribosome-binding factor RbfA [Planctomycetota bacterium]|nr:30S ribosome-binding factor RbfA [Planctomycetota bacterium]
MQPRRISRLESLIQERVAKLVTQDMADPRLGLLTITRVKLDRELTTCQVFWSVFGDEKKRRLNERALAHARGFVRREIAAILHTRTVPQVSFVYDESIVGELRVQQILKQLREQRSDAPPDEGEVGDDVIDGTAQDDGVPDPAPGTDEPPPAP